MIRNLIILIYFFVLISCGSSSSNKSLRQRYSEDLIANAFLNAKMFEYDNTVESIEIKDAAHILSKLEFIYLFQPQYTNNNIYKLQPKVIPCGIETNSIQIISKKIMKIIFMLDDTKCEQKINSLFNTQIKGFMSIHCSETDLSNYMSQNAYDVIYNHIKTFCPKDKEQRWFVNLEIKLNNDQLNAKGMAAIMGADGKECITYFDGKNYSLNNCNYYSRNIETTKDNVKTKELIIIKSHDLIGSENNVYYNSGTLDLLINNWSGTLKYKPDNIQPSYELYFQGTKAIGNYKTGIVSIVNDTAQ